MDWYIRYSPKFFFPTRAQFLQSCMPQEFQFPMTMMKYVWMNPKSSKAYQKLIQCCKLFFIKNPILIVYALYYYATKDTYEWLYKPAEADEWQSIGNKIQSYFWPTKKLNIEFESHILQTIASDVLSKIIYYNVEDLYLRFHKLTYDELKFLASGVKKCQFHYNQITYDNGEIVPVESVLQLFSNCEDIEIYSHDETCNSYVALADACQNIKKLRLDVPDDFDAVGFYEYLKKIKNCSIIAICLWNRNRGIDGVFDEVLTADSFDFVPPAFRGIGIDSNTFKKIQKIQEEVTKKLC